MNPNPVEKSNQKIQKRSILLEKIKVPISALEIATYIGGFAKNLNRF